MATPILSHPTLYTSSELRSKPALATSIAQLANEAFFRSKAGDPIKWSNETFRFSTVDSLHTMLGENSTVALIFDLSQQKSGEEGIKQGRSELNRRDAAGFEDAKLVACAAAVPWKGGWAKESAGIESGWEIKAVCVDGDEKYLHRGLAQKLLTTLEDLLISDTKLQLQREAGGGQGELSRILRCWL